MRVVSLHQEISPGKVFSSVRRLTTSPIVSGQNAGRLTYRECIGSPCSLDKEAPWMRFATKCFASVVFVFLVSSLCSDAQAQSGSRGGGYSAPAMSAPPAPSMSPAPTQSFAPQSVAPVHSAPIAVGSGCASGNCGGAVSASPSVSYSPSMTYSSYAPVHQPTTQYHQSYYQAAPATYTNRHCHTRRRIFRHR